MRLCCRDRALPRLPHGEGKRRSWRRGSEGTHSISIHGPSAAGSAGDSPGCFLPVLACPTALTAHISSPPSSYCWTGQTCVLPSCDFLFSPADSLKFALLCIPVVKNSALCNPSPNSHDSPRQSDAPSSLVTWRNLFYMGHPVILSSNTLSFFFPPQDCIWENVRHRERAGEKDRQSHAQCGPLRGLDRVALRDHNLSRKRQSTLNWLSQQAAHTPSCTDPQDTYWPRPLQDVKSKTHSEGLSRPVPGHWITSSFVHRRPRVTYRWISGYQMRPCAQTLPGHHPSLQLVQLPGSSYTHSKTTIMPPPHRRVEPSVSPGHAAQLPVRF